MEGDQENSAPATCEMPRYKCHKEVWALKIARIEQAPANQERMHASGDWLLVPAEEGYAPIYVGHEEFILRHKPQVGGYYVVYDDGYASYSPAGPFEAGYALMATGGKDQYRKKPVVIDAFQMTRERRADNRDWPNWLNEAWCKSHTVEGAVFPKDFPESDGTDELCIFTKEGVHLVSFDDWIIRGVQGELYPCKPDIFLRTYDQA